MDETLKLLRRYLRDMWHRRWIGLAAAWLVALVGIAVVYRMPERYEASARIQVDTASLLRPLLAGLAVQPNVNQQVAMMSRTLVSRPNVARVVRSTDMDLRARTDAERDRIVEEVMSAIRLRGSARDNLYQLSYLDTDPVQARKVVEALLTIFIESTVGTKRDDQRNAVKFLDDQIKSYENALNAAENRVKEFKLRYLGLLQRDGGDYFSRMAALKERIAQAQIELDAAMQTRDAYKREVAGEQPTLLDTTAPPPIDSVPELDGRIAQLTKQLDELSRRYTDIHPDVVQTKRLISELEQERKTQLEARRKAAGEMAGGTPNLDRNPVFQQLRVSLAEAEAQVAAARSKLAGLEAQHAQAQAQAKMVPQIEAELAQLNRDYEVQKRTYESLLKRRESGAMGIDMQAAGTVEMRVIEPARVSPRPVAPNRLTMLGLVFLLSIGAGVAASFLVSQAAPTFHDASRLREFTSRPVLGPVTMIRSPALIRSRRRRSLLFAGGVSGLVAVLASVAVLTTMMWRTVV